MTNLINKKRSKYKKLPLKIKVSMLKRVMEEGHGIKQVKIGLKLGLLRIQHQLFDCKNTPAQLKAKKRQSSTVLA